MAQRSSMGLGGAVEGGFALGRAARFAPSALAFVVAISAIGGAFVGGRVSWEPAWSTIGELTKSPATAAWVGDQRGMTQVDRANDDGYLDGLAKALGFDSLEQMAKANNHPMPSGLARR
jgi:hypothetical protein